jgi:hypothetical protein
MNDSFEKLNKKFNIDSKEDIIEKAEKELQLVEQRKNNIITTLENLPVFTKDDQNFLIQETKDLISITNDVIDCLKEELRVGAKSSMFEAFAQVATVKMQQIKELKDIYKMLLDVALFNKPKEDEESDKKKTEDITLKANDFLKIILEAQKNSTLHSIDATFEVLPNNEQKDKK